MEPLPTPTRPKSSRRFVAAWAGAAILGAGVLFPLFTLGVLNWFDTREYYWISQLYQRKAHALAAKQNGPRLIIYGGSATTFGVDAELIEKALGIPVVNFASHGVLGLDYQIAWIKRSAKPDDTVLFIPELEAYGDNEAPSDGLREYAFSYDRRYLFRLGPMQTLRLLFLSPFSDYADSAARWNVKLSSAGEGDPYETRHGYSYIGLNANGDLRSLAPSKDVTPTPFPNLFTPHARQSLIALHRWCERRHIALCLTWPNRARAPKDNRGGQFLIHEQAAKFCGEQRIPVIGTPEESVYPKELFIDTLYHLNELGRRIRTEKLITHLRETFGMSTPHAGPKTVCLLGARTSLANRTDIFAATENVDYKYLSETPLDHPDCLLPGELPGLVKTGARVVCIDDATEELTAKAGLQPAEIKRSESSFPDWIQRYPQHLFAMSLVGVDESPLKDTEKLPKYFAQFFSEKGFRVGLIGTGKLSGIHRITGNPEMARWSKARHTVLKAPMRFDFQIGLRSGPLSIFEKAHPPIVVEGDGLADPTPGLAVAVIDPERGIVVARTTFQDHPLVEWKLRQFTLPNSDAVPTRTSPEK